MRSVLESALGPLNGAGVPDAEATTAVLRSSAFAEVSVWSIDKPTMRSCESVLGEITSSASGQLDSSTFDDLRTAIEPFADNGALPENVSTTAAIAFRPDRS